MVIGGVRASVVLDASSYAHRIGERHGEKRIDADLLALRALLEGYGFEVVDLSVAAPLVAVELGPDSNGHGAHGISERSARWWRSQSRSWQRRAWIRATEDPAGRHRRRGRSVST